MDANNNVMAITESNTVTNCMLHFVWQLSSTQKYLVENHQIASIFLCRLNLYLPWIFKQSIYMYIKHNKHLFSHGKTVVINWAISQWWHITFYTLYIFLSKMYAVSRLALQFCLRVEHLY